VEQNVTMVNRSEETSNRLLQRMAEIGQNVAKLRERDVLFTGEVSELRSRLEVVVRECDERVAKEPRVLSGESAAFMSSLKQENGLSDRVQILENACQQVIAMPAVVLEATESLRAELRQMVDPLREDMHCLKRANASSQRHGKEFRDLAESNDSEQCSSPNEVTSLHRRLSDLEAAYAAQSKDFGQFQQHLTVVEQTLSEEMQKSWSTVNDQVVLVTQSVELLRKEYFVVQDRIKHLTDSVANACASSIIKAEASLSKELIAMKNSNLVVGGGAVGSPTVPSSRAPMQGQLKEMSQEGQLERANAGLKLATCIGALGSATVPSPQLPVEGQLMEMPQESQLERANTGLHEMAAGSLISRISALESMMSFQLGSLKSIVSQIQTPSQVPAAIQSNNTLAPRVSLPPQMASAPARSSMQTRLSSRCASVSPCSTVSGISAATKDGARMLHSASRNEARVLSPALNDEPRRLRWNGGSVNGGSVNVRSRRAIYDPGHLLASKPHEQCSQVKMARVGSCSPQAGMQSFPASPTTIPRL